MRGGQALSRSRDSIVGTPDQRAMIGACKRGLTSHDVSLHGPAGQLIAVGELELAQDRADVRLNGFDGDEQVVGDFLVRVAASDKAHDLLLARGQQIQLRVGRRDLPCPEGVQHETGQARAEGGVAGGDAVDCLDQLGRGDRLSDVPASARADDLDDVLGGV